MCNFKWHIRSEIQMLCTTTIKHFVSRYATCWSFHIFLSLSFFFKFSLEKCNGTFIFLNYCLFFDKYLVSRTLWGIWHLPYGQMNDLGCHSFIDSNRRHESPGSKAKHSFTRGPEGSMRFRITRVTWKSPHWMLHTHWFLSQMRKLGSQHV